MDKPIYMSGCPAATIAMWRAEVEALPKKKQEKWRKSGRNEEGTFRQVRFRGGHFQVKVLADTSKGKCLLPVEGWAPMIAEGELVKRSQIIDTYGEEIMQKLDDVLGEENTKNGVSYVMHPQSQRMLEAERRGGIKARDEELRRVMLENSTGHHHRNKVVKVATAAGEPVRA